MRSQPLLPLARKVRSVIGVGHSSGPLDRLFVKGGTKAGFVLDFDGPVPDRAQLAARVLSRAARLPALNLLVPPTGRQRWRPAVGPLDEAVHLRDEIVPPNSLDTATGELLRLPLPRDPHPAWDVSLLHDPANRLFRICYRVHHGIQDGVGAAHAVLALLGDHTVSGPHPYRSAVPSLKGVWLAGQGLWGAVRPGNHWAVLREPSSHHTRWTYQDVPEARLREEAARHDASVNDVCLAALAQAFRLWHRTDLALEEPCPDVRSLMPMSLRQEYERHAPGNRLGGHRVTLPCSAPDLAEAVQRVRRQTEAVRTTRAGDVVRLAMRVLPAWLGEHAGNAFTAKGPAPVVATSIALPAPVTCLGARLRAASVFGDLYNERLCYVSFTRAAGIVRCGVLYDSVLPKAESLPRLWSAVLLR